MTQTVQTVQTVQRGRWAILTMIVVLAGCSHAPRAQIAPAQRSGQRYGQRPAEPGTYIVVEGDSLYRIAKAHDVSLKSLIRVNKLKDPKSLRVGMVLRLPKGAKAKPPPPPEEPKNPFANVEIAKPIKRCDNKQRRPSGGLVSKSGFVWPVDGVVISRYGKREGALHQGIDIAAPIGTPIWASQNGKVIFSGVQSGYGRLVIIEHADRKVTIYAHNSQNCVAQGRQVKQGDLIGLVGRSGGANSPWLHFEVRVGPKATNPRKYLPR